MPSVTSWDLPTSSRVNRAGESVLKREERGLQVLIWSYLKALSLSNHAHLMCAHRRRFDLQNPSRMDRNVEMFLNVEKTLVQVMPSSIASWFLVKDRRMSPPRVKEITK